MCQYQTYQSLIANNSEKLTYLELLNTQEWRQRRETILERDNYSCEICQGRETMRWPHAKTGEWLPHEVTIPDTCTSASIYYLDNNTVKSFRIYNDRQIIYTPTNTHRRMHVHHRIYINNHLPWEYADSHLITMCERCHFNWHQKYRAKVYEQTERGLVEVASLTPCQRCGGAGRLPQYDHVEAGICFRCWGAGFEEWVTDSLKQRSKIFYDKCTKK